jgi:type IV secretion system protein VirB1
MRTRDKRAARGEGAADMLPGLELIGCTGLAVPAEVMQHVVRVESSFNPYAIGVVGGRLVRQPSSLPEAVSTAKMLEQAGYNFSLGLAQVNRHNLAAQGLDSYERAFDACANLQAGARILADCHRRAGQDWGKALSCYYSGNFVTGYRHGYVQKVFASWSQAADAVPVAVGTTASRGPSGAHGSADPVNLVHRRIQTPGAGIYAPAVDAGGSAPHPVAGAPVATALHPDGPVVVQPMGQPPSTQPPPGGPSADAAFVFQQ